jgi:ubiquitin-protein ligase
MALGPIKRLRKELQSLQSSQDPEIQLFPEEDNIRLWHVSARSKPDWWTHPLGT